MAYVTPISFDPEHIEYWLDGGHGCDAAGVNDRPFSYRTQGTALVWFGQGLADVDIQAGSALTPDQFPLARNLMKGRHPHTGDQLVKPKLGVYEDSKLPLAPLVRAVHAIAHEANVPVREVLRDDKSRKMFAAAERAVTSKGEAAKLRADEAGDIADAAGLNVDHVWGEERFLQAAAGLWETVTDVDADGNFRERRQKRRRIVGNAGYDITVEVTKEDSLLLAFNTPDGAETLEKILTTAVETGLTWLENLTGYVRRGKHGDGKTADILPGNGFLGWYMIHRAARPVNGADIGDPHWHIHLAIANLTFADGKWSTIAAGGRDLMRHVPALQHLVHGLIRHQLHTQFGVHYRHDKRSDTWRIAGFPADTVRRFSKRNHDIHDTLIQLGYDPDTATRAQHRIAEQRTRNPKAESLTEAGPTLQELWQQEERDAGADPVGHVQRVYAGGREADDTEPPPQHPHVDAHTIAAALSNPDAGLTSHSRRFSRIDALRRVAAALPTGFATPAQLEALTDEVLAHVEFVELPPRHGTSGEADDADPAASRRHSGTGNLRNSAYYTTRDVIDAETVILRAAKASHANQSDVRVTDSDVIALGVATAEASLGYGLADEQRAALMRLVTQGRMIDTVNGVPGSGKSTLMRAVRIVFEAAGHVVGGAATAAVAALNLQAESGIESRTIASLVHAIKRQDPAVLRGVDVLVVDEANLTNDRDRAVLYKRAAQTGTRIIEIGDSQQLRGVGVGSLFGHVHEIVDGAELHNNRRQAEEDEREAIAAWRDARYAEALTLWAGKGRLVATETSQESTAAMLAKWWELRQGAPDPHTEIRGLVMLAATNNMVRRLNQAAQAMRYTEGELGDAHTYALAGGDNLVLHVGDHILMRVNAWNDPSLADVRVLNGYRAVVRAIAHDGTITAEWQFEGADGLETHTAHLSPKYVAVGGVELGYTMTVHKSEGLTVRDQWFDPDGETSGATVLFAAAGADNPTLHVGTSRHRGSVWMFTPREELETDQDTHQRGIPTSRAELTDRAVEKLAERARATEESPDDLPVVVQLGLPEFAAETGRGYHATLQEHDADAEAAAREAQRRRQQRAEQTEQRRRERAQRQAEDQRRRDAAHLLLSDLWRHEPGLVTAITASEAFGALAQAIAAVVDDSPLDIEEVLAEIPLDTLISDDIVDKAAFAAWAVNDAAARIISGQAELDRERRIQQQEFELMRDQAGDLLREAWSHRPALAQAVIDSPAFDAVVRGLDRHTTAGFNPRELLEKLPIRKIESPTIRDKARFTAYSLSRVVERELEREQREHLEADRAAATRHRHRITAEYLRDAWPDHPAIVQSVIDGPAFDALALRVEQALDHDVSVPRAFAAVPPDRVGGSRVRNPSAYATRLFTIAVEQQISDRDNHTPQPEPEHLVPHWSQRELGDLDDLALQARHNAEQQRTQELAAAQQQALATATRLRNDADAGRGEHVQRVDDNLARLRELAATVDDIADLQGQWQNVIDEAAQLAGERGLLEDQRDELGRLSRGRRAELAARIEAMTAAEDQLHEQARALATRAGELQRHTGPQPQRDQIKAEAAAAEADLPHAREVARRRDLTAAEAAERHAARLTEQHRDSAAVLDTVRSEIELRQSMPEPARQIEQRQREQGLEPAFAATQPNLDTAPGVEHNLTAPEPLPEVSAEPRPPEPQA